MNVNKPKSAVELKRDYWSQPEHYFTPDMVEALVHEYGDRPATSGEALYIVRYHCGRAAEILAKDIKKFILRSR